MYENNQKPVLALLVGLDLGQYDFEESLNELIDLAQTAGAEVAGVVTQKRDAPDSGTAVGEGKLDEIREFCRSFGVELIIFDSELTPRQLANLEHETDVRVIDRTMLILDIFATRARSSEGKLQVELAQLKYLLPRLTGKGVEMSRLGGGIGTRGPGESKLETDRRHIRRRIDALRERLDEVEKRRGEQRARRKKDEIVTAAIVGYTNAGKSTLMNTLTQAGVLAEDKLFATLDTTARALALPSGASVLLVDTVGLIRRLPHHLVNAFKSTLEAASDADILIVVSDASSASMHDRLKVTMQLLEELGASGKPVVNVFNKCDRVPNLDFVGIKGVKLSAKTGAGLDALLSAIDEAMPVRMLRASLLLPFDKVGLSQPLRESGTVFSEEYTENGLLIDVSAPLPMMERVREYFAGRSGMKE